MESGGAVSRRQTGCNASPCESSRVEPRPSAESDRELDPPPSVSRGDNASIPSQRLVAGPLPRSISRRRRSHDETHEQESNRRGKQAVPAIGVQEERLHIKKPQG